jgi:uncharacterized membrane protein
MKNKLIKVLMIMALFLTTAIAGTWINITINSNKVTLEDLASTYYGDVKDADIIYDANRDVIKKNRKLKKGMKLEVPVTDKFRDQPEHLGWR